MIQLLHFGHATVGHFMASNSFLPSNLTPPSKLSSGPIVNLIDLGFKWLFNFLGIIIVLWGIFQILKYVHQSVSGKEVSHTSGFLPTGTGQKWFTGVTRGIVEILIGFLVLGIVLSGSWVGIVNGLIGVSNTVGHTISHSLHTTSSSSSGGGSASTTATTTTTTTNP